MIFEENHNIRITKKELKKLFEFANSSMHILFDKACSDYLDGVPMVALLGLCSPNSL